MDKFACLTEIVLASRQHNNRQITADQFMQIIEDRIHGFGMEEAEELSRVLASVRLPLGQPHLTA